MTRLTLTIFIFFIPLSSQAQVYRCATPEGTIYSQMPCSDNAERLPEYDQEVAENVGAAAASPGEPGGVEAPVEEKTPSAMENFIATLENQRTAQLGEIDGNIRDLQQQLNAGGDEAPDDNTRESLANRLATLTAERESINEQYAAMISEASQRAGSENTTN